MPQRSVATNYTFEQQRSEINLLAADFWTHKGTVDGVASSYLKHDGSNDFTGGTLAVPAAFTINSNGGAGTLTISGNLNVTGTTTTVNTATLDVTDKNITIAKGSTSDANSDGAGITIDSGTDITWNFVDANDAWVSSIGVEATTFLKGPYGQFTGSGTPATGMGVEVNAPDANTGQITSYDRGNSAYKDLRIKGSSVGIYTGTTNALEATFSSTGLVVEGEISVGTSTGGKTLTLYGADSSSFRISKSGVLAYDHIFDGSTYEIKNNNGSVGIPIVFGTKTGGGESLRIGSDGLVTIQGSSGNAAHTHLKLINTDQTSSGETGQTNDIEFSFTDNVNNSYKGAKISAYKAGDWVGNADYDAGLKFYTVDNEAAFGDAYVERLCIRGSGVIASNLSTGAVLELTRTSTNTSGLCGKLVFGNSDWDSSMASIQSYQDGANDNASLRFYTQASAAGGEQEALRITSGGCVYANNLGFGQDDRWKIRPNTSNTELAFEYSTSSTLADTNIKMFLNPDGRLNIKTVPAAVGGTMGDYGLMFQASTTPTDGQVIQGITFNPHDTQIGRARAGIAAIANANGGSHPHAGADLVMMTRFSADGHDLDVATDERLRIHSNGQLELKVPDSNPALKITPSGTNAPAAIDFNTPGTGSAILKVQNSPFVYIKNDGRTGINIDDARFGQGNGASQFYQRVPMLGVQGSIAIGNLSSTDTDQRELAFYRRAGATAGTAISTHHLGRIAWYGSSNDTSFPDKAYSIECKPNGGGWTAGANRLGSIQFHNHEREVMRLNSTGFVGVNCGDYNGLTSLDVRHHNGTAGNATVQYLFTLCAGRNSNRGLEIGTGHPSSGNQNDGAVYYNAKDTESNSYAAQHNWQLGGTTAMTLGYTAQPYLGVGTATPVYKGHFRGDSDISTANATLCIDDADNTVGSAEPILAFDGGGARQGRIMVNDTQGMYLGVGSSNKTVIQLNNKADLYVHGNHRGWATMQLGNIRYHCRQHYAPGNSVTTNSLMRVKRFWWGWGTYKITAKMHYYGGGSHESTFFLNGYGTNDSYSIIRLDESHNSGATSNYYGGTNLISITTPSNNSPGNGSCSFVDVQINIPNYTYAIIVMECMSSQYGEDPNNMGNDEYVLL